MCYSGSLSNCSAQNCILKVNTLRLVLISFLAVDVETARPTLNEKPIEHFFIVENFREYKFYKIFKI